MTSDLDNGFGDRLRSIRNERGETQRETAAYLGLSRRRYQDYEAGHRPPDVRVRDLARRLRVPFAWLAHGAAVAVAVVIVALFLANVGCALVVWHLPEPYCLNDEWQRTSDYIADND